MIVTIEGRQLELCQADITDQSVDAIVNAANASLAGGGGVDGAIHRKGGPSIMQETDQRYPDGCPTGSAVISKAGDLSAKYVIHAVGPVWCGRSEDAELLRAAHSACLKLADEHQCRSIAFPAISTGVYGYPIGQAAEIALGCCREFLSQPSSIELIRFVLFDSSAYQTFAQTLEKLNS